MCKNKKSSFEDAYFNVQLASVLNVEPESASLAKYLCTYKESDSGFVLLSMYEKETQQIRTS